MSSAARNKSAVDERVGEDFPLQKGPEIDGEDDLLATINTMTECLGAMKDIIQKANFIALNASIEAARTQSQTENFSLVAEQVKRQGERTEELALGLGKEVQRLEQKALRAISVNYTDIANDIIDKIDRNLFERNCDMQAWAGFRENVDCAFATRGQSKAQILETKSKDEKDENYNPISGACKRLEVLANTYNVYVDVLLINDQGFVCATAYNQNLIGTDLSREEFYQEPMTAGHTHVTDMSYDPLLKKRTVTYACPVRSNEGEVIGVIANKFNWDYVDEMVDKMPLGKDGNIDIISEDGTVLARRHGYGVLIDNLVWLTAGEMSLNKLSGYTVECARNGRINAWGYCHTYGFNAYEGKEWSAIVSHPLNLNESKFISEKVTRDPEDKKQVAPNANADLEAVAQTITKHVLSINAINNETNMLAVNAAIQAGVAGAEGEAFSVIASEIGQLARQSEDFVNNVNIQTKKLEGCVRNTVFNRLGEAAFDCIDKIDRNLYERNCDVQAFASFSEVERFLSKQVDEKEIATLLRKLHEIYEVYHDIYILDSEGTVCASAIHRELVGQNQGDRSWFRDCMSGNLVVTDLYHSSSINDYAVTFAAPVMSAAGKVIGVMTTRFNCGFIYDIMKATIVGDTAEVYLVNSKGNVIGSPDGEGILEESFAHLRAFKLLNSKPHGHTVEADRKVPNLTNAFGFAKTQGYINYKGKGWGVIIKQELGEKAPDNVVDISDFQTEGNS